MWVEINVKFNNQTTSAVNEVIIIMTGTNTIHFPILCILSAKWS